MQEKKYGVARLLRAIEDNISDRNINTFARLLNYEPGQLKEDIEGIRFIDVINKDERGNN